ncbi:metal ABC transporter ATP-binding protein [Arthrobacter roseus]|uniref:metal ABC transporter ATP-binding protein n=1 Tax=Arthrobacter roseus TaxID=136274 RepID=UPI001962B9A4|nr:metal ABC transporter ATP-binding protein [Arthrobacter roseus]MBM7849062.1 manganese transport system ATP-binding protein [Arthrobacter roseus]
MRRYPVSTSIEPSIHVENLSVRYQETLALSDVELRIEPGRICGLIGMNGSGKSTLFKALMGLVQPDTGRIILNGMSIRAARRHNAVTYVPQSEDVDWSFPLSVRDVVMMGRYGRMGPTRRPRIADRAAVEHALERVQLTTLAHRQIGQLSGGQKKRVFVARGIAQEASLLLLDEPFAGVDRTSEANITGLLKELKAENRTILVSTHDLAGVPELCDEAVLLHQRVLAHGTPTDVLTNENLARAFGAAATPAEGQS